MQTAGWTKTATVDLNPRGAVAAAEWSLQRLEDLGVPVPPGNRLERAKLLLAGVVSGDTSLRVDDPTQLRLIAEAEGTIFEQFVVCKATAGVIIDLHKAKLEEMLSGRDSPDDKNPQAKSTQFELYAGGILAMGGAPVGLVEPDLGTRIAGEEIGVAAKRVQSVRQLRKRVKHAVAQIVRSGRRGIVVVNADLAVGPSMGPGSTMDLGRAFDERLTALHRMDDYLADHPRVLARIAMARDHIWDLGGERPELEIRMFRQYRHFPTRERDDRALAEFFGSLELRIRERLPEF